MNEQVFIAAAAGFEAAVRVDALPPGHRAARLHGHSYLAKLRARLSVGGASFPGGEVGALRARMEADVEHLKFLNYKIDYYSSVLALETATAEDIAASETSNA